MIIADKDAVGFTFKGEHLCRYCTRDVLAEIVYENAYRTPDETESLGIIDLMRVCQEPEDVPFMVGRGSYNTGVYDSDDYPKPFLEEEAGERCDNPECGELISDVYAKAAEYL
jgi:hypothetical protein